MAEWTNHAKSALFACDKRMAYSFTATIISSSFAVAMTDIFFKRPDVNRGGRPRKYKEADFERMRHMRKVEKKSYDEIGAEFGVKGTTIKNHFYEHLHVKTTDKPIRAPNINVNWRFD